MDTPSYVEVLFRARPRKNKRGWRNDAVTEFSVRQQHSNLVFVAAPISDSMT